MRSCSWWRFVDSHGGFVSSKSQADAWMNETWHWVCASCDKWVHLVDSWMTKTAATIRATINKSLYRSDNWMFANNITTCAWSFGDRWGECPHTLGPGGGQLLHIRRSLFYYLRLVYKLLGVVVLVGVALRRDVNPKCNRFRSMAPFRFNPLICAVLDKWMRVIRRVSFNISSSQPTEL